MNKILGNLSLKTKLQILTFIPLAGLLYFIAASVVNSYNQVRSMNDLTPLLKVTNHIGKIVKEQETERTYTAGFVTSRGVVYKQQMEEQRIKVDKLYENMSSYINNEEIKPSLKKLLLTKQKDIYKRMSEVRKQITVQNIESLKATNVLNFYTILNNLLLETILELSHYSDNSEITTGLIAYYNILSTKDDTELIRAYGINTINELDNITDENDNSKLILYSQIKLKSIIASEKQKLAVFFKVANSSVEKYYNDLIKKTDIEEYKDFVRALANDSDLELYQGEGESFFALASKKLDIMAKLEKMIASKLQKDMSSLKKKAQTVFVSNLILGVIVLVITLILGLLIYRRIDSDMKYLKGNLLDFFDFIAKKKEDIDIRDVDGSDEFAVLINTINKEVIKTKELAFKDNIVLKEIDETMSRVENGFFTYTVSSEAGSEAVNILKLNVNNMIRTTKQKLDTLGLILESYGQYKYDFQLNENQRKGMAGDIGTLSSSLLALGEDISIFMATFSNVIDKLNSNTNILLSTSSSLSNSSNKQAASLEETAASIDEITSTIQSNAKNVAHMGIISDELREKAQNGNTLANDTSNAMEQINEKITQINEAIGIIDQIAFQTNILSLNAAVEAATAGEAGKGFAVVAQEVRNLASRSAEAANEIKQLVESATHKADEGKKVTSHMIEGYNELNGKIGETKTIIDDVSTASQDQKNKIVQINDAISSIDHMTQENASDARGLNEISNEVEKLSQEIETTISQARFDRGYKKIVCDPDLARKISRYKRYHISFKTENFKKLNEFQSFSVVDHGSCEMGKWMQEQEKAGAGFTKLEAWEELKKVHGDVHRSIQEYVDENAAKKPKEILEEKALSIEENTLKVFKSLNNLLKQKCEY